jgi:imidazolonepropionase-like amidohydrolase
MPIVERAHGVVAVSLAALVAAVALPAGAQTMPPASRGAFASGVLAITDVNVIPMTADTVMRGHTVVIRDGRVVSVGPAADAQIPAGARRIEGRGRYLIPGLADMHTHLFADDATPDSLAADELGVMVANGVTAARFMIGTPEHLALRRDIAAGRILGPQLWLAGPHLTGRAALNARVVTTPDDARIAVREIAGAGYDFIKVTSALTRPVYDAIVAESRSRGIRVVGHVEGEVTLARAFAVGQQVEHLDGYFEAALADSAPMRTSLTQGGIFRLDAWRSMDFVDDRKIDSLAGATARAGVWSSPTLMVFNRAFATGQTDAEIRGRPDFRLMPTTVRDLYLRAGTRYWADANAEVRTEARRRRYVEVRNRAVKAIVDSGGRVLAGSDTPEWFHVYGFGLHRELAALVDAGLSPHEALTAATRAPAEFLGASAEWGTIAPGRRADVLLLAANPLDDIRNTTRIEAVAIGGRWLERAELDALIRRAVERVGGG